MSLIPSDSGGGDNIQVLQSMFQADTTIARACIRKKCDVAFMNDTDLAAYAGKCCVGIADFRFAKGATKNSIVIADASIFSPSKETIYTAICRDALHFSPIVKSKLAGLKQRKVPFIIDAAQPLFDKVDDPRLRALYAVTAGCDVFPDGVYGLQASKILSVIKQQGGANFNQLVQYFASVHQKKKMPGAHLEAIEAMILAYVDAFLFEPANATKDDDTNHTNHPDGGDATITVLNTCRRLLLFYQSLLKHLH